MQEHVYNCVSRKLNGKRKTDEIVAECKIKLEDVRLLDEHVGELFFYGRKSVIHTHRPSHFLNAAPTNFNREYLAQR